MVKCPECEGAIDVEEEDLDEGDPLSCDECGADLRVVSTDPLELQSADEFAEDEEDADIIEDEDEEEAEDEDWK
jgi:alpha-aminoadipate/glutamate carrier protein LysW